MRATLLVCLFLLSVASAQAYTDNEILSALQRKTELLDPDSMLYLTDKDKKVIDNFLKSNEKLFSSLGKKEAFYYVELVNLNRNQNVTPNLALLAIDSAKRHSKDYTSQEEQQLEGAFQSFYKKGYISKEKFTESHL